MVATFSRSTATNVISKVQIALLLDPDGLRDPGLAELVTEMVKQLDGRVATRTSLHEIRLAP
jgi:hypothetical protein